MFERIVGALTKEKNGAVILGGGSPKNFYLQGQPTLWEVYGIPKGGNDYFIQFTTDQVVWGGLSGATPSEAVSWGKVNPGVLPDTVVSYCDSTIAFPLFCEYAAGSANGRRPMSGVLWDVFTGSAPYRDVLVRTMKPAFPATLVWNVAASASTLVSNTRRNCARSS